MKCNKVKALVMDYIDEELNQKLKHDLASHLESCPSCKEMEQTLRQTIIEPLRQAEKIKAPDRVWYQLKETIVNRKQRVSLPGLLAQWSGYFRIKRPVLVPVTAMIVVILLVSVFFFRKPPFTTQDTLNAYLEEQAELLSQLAENGEEDYFGIDDVSLGTSIERYLL